MSVRTGRRFLGSKVQPATPERSGVLAPGISGTAMRRTEFQAIRTIHGAVRTSPVPGMTPGSKFRNRMSGLRLASSTVVAMRRSLLVA